MSKQFWGVIAAIVIVLVGIFLLTGNKSDSSSGGSTASASNHVEGKNSKGVTLVEFGDFQCPYCQVYSTTVKQVVEQYSDDIEFQFVNFPLTNVHQNAFAAARAAEAADKQGKYWEMHDLLYSTNDPNGASGWVSSNAASSYFNKFAKQLGLNEDQFKKDYASSAVNSTINADMSKGTKLGVEGTPTFFINGKKTDIGNTAADFQKALDAAISKSAPASSGSTTQSKE